MSFSVVYIIQAPDCTIRSPYTECTLDVREEKKKKKKMHAPDMYCEISTVVCLFVFVIVDFSYSPTSLNLTLQIQAASIL